MRKRYELPAYRTQLVCEPRSAWTTRRRCRRPADVADTFREYVGDADREHVVVFLLDIDYRFIGLQVVSIGSLDTALVEPREVFKAAFLCNASAVILAHNHPSGDATPSEPDRRLTERITWAGTLLNIEVLDHVIVGRDSHVSLYERGMMVAWEDEERREDR